MLGEMAAGRRVSSRRNRHPRGSSQMSNANIRHRGEWLLQKHEPLPALST